MGFFSDLFSDGDSDSNTFEQKNWRGANLAGKSFKGATLEQCELVGANLQNADFTGATLEQCNFSQADLRGAKFDDATVEQCTFTHAKLDGATTNGASFSQCEGLPISFRSWDDIEDDDEKWKIVSATLQRLVSLAPDGAVRERRDDSKMFFAATDRGRPYRLLVDMDDGSCLLEVKLRGRGRLMVHFDATATANPAEQADSEWDKEDGGEQTHFIGANLYIKDDADTLKHQVAMIRPDMPDTIGRYMRGGNMHWFKVESEQLVLSYRATVVNGDIVERVRNGLEFADHLARWFT